MLVRYHCIEIKALSSHLKILESLIKEAMEYRDWDCWLHGVSFAPGPSSSLQLWATYPTMLSLSFLMQTKVRLTGLLWGSREQINLKHLKHCYIPNCSCPIIVISLLSPRILSNNLSPEPLKKVCTSSQRSALGQFPLPDPSISSYRKVILWHLEGLTLHPTCPLDKQVSEEDSLPMGSKKTPGSYQDPSTSCPSHGRPLLLSSPYFLPISFLWFFFLLITNLIQFGWTRNSQCDLLSLLKDVLAPTFRPSWNIQGGPSATSTSQAGIAGIFASFARQAHEATQLIEKRNFIFQYTQLWDEQKGQLLQWHG